MLVNSLQTAEVTGKWGEFCQRNGLVFTWWCVREVMMKQKMIIKT